MTEAERFHRNPSYEEKVNAMEPTKLWREFDRLNGELAKYHVTSSISIICYGATNYGHLYEDKSYPSGSTHATALNCLMATLHDQPSLLKLPIEDFKDLAQTIAQVSLVSEAMYSKVGRFKWLQRFKDTPKKIVYK